MTNPQVVPASIGARSTFDVGTHQRTVQNLTQQGANTKECGSGPACHPFFRLPTLVDNTTGYSQPVFALSSKGRDALGFLSVQYFCGNWCHGMTVYGSLDELAITLY